uniref:universal stress protein n=1 Tax=Sedimentibacter sp. B4 TaxID=304766 RepID=UPI000592737B
PAHGVVRRILVGVDGSEDGLRAVRYATRAALVTGAEEWIVNVADPGAMVTGMWELVVTTEALQKAGQSITAEAVGAATGLGLPSARVTSEVLVGQAADVLAELSAKADLLVVGRRSMSGLERMFVGSTSVSVAALAHCPVVVISSSSTPQETGG